MASIVVELQRDSLNATGSVPNLLRKALVIATKLRLPDLRTWIESELGGYQDSESVPPYRIVTGQVIGTDVWGRMAPVLFRETETLTMCSTVRLFDSAAELEGLLQRADNEGSLQVPMSPEQNAILARATGSGEPITYTRVIRVEDVRGALDAVRTEILKWSLKLEQDGILGEGLTFSDAEREKAADVHYTTNFYGHVGNVSQHGRGVNQTATISSQPAELAKFVSDFRDHIDELRLDALQRQQASAQLSTLSAQIEAGEPNPVIVREAVHSLRNITEGAIGSLLASAMTTPGVWHAISTFLSNF